MGAAANASEYAKKTFLASEYSKAAVLTYFYIQMLIFINK